MRTWFLFDTGNEENMQLYFNSVIILFRSVHFYRPFLCLDLSFEFWKQINFVDHTKVIVTPNAEYIIYVNKKGKRTTFCTSQHLQASENVNEMLSRYLTRSKKENTICFSWNYFVLQSAICKRLYCSCDTNVEQINSFVENWFVSNLPKLPLTMTESRCCYQMHLAQVNFCNLLHWHVIKDNISMSESIFYWVGGFNSLWKKDFNKL
jgi:hypothetical protein